MKRSFREGQETGMQVMAQEQVAAFLEIGSTITIENREHRVERVSLVKENNELTIDIQI